MNYIQVKSPVSGPTGYHRDIHFGDRAFANEAHQAPGNLDWLKEHQHEAFGLLMGDVFNIAGRDTKTSPFETDPGEIIASHQVLRAYAHLFIGAIRATTSGASSTASASTRWSCSASG